MKWRRKEPMMSKLEKSNMYHSPHYMVFPTAGGMGITATVASKSLASMITEEHKKPYSKQCNGSDADYMLLTATLCHYMPYQFS